MNLTRGTCIGPHTELVELLESADGRSLWRGRDRQLETDVVVEVGPVRLGTHALARYRRRAQTAERFVHPHVFSVVGHGLDSGIPYVVTEPLAGVSLLERVRSAQLGSLMGLRDCARVIEQLLEALERLHREALARVGVTPDRVMLVGALHPDAKLRVDVIEGRPDATIGQLGLAAPERMEQDLPAGTPRTPGEVDARAALWEVAALAYFAMIGKSPFPGPIGKSWVAAIQKGDFPRPALRGDGGEASRIELDAFFRSSLAFEPSERFESAGEMLGAWRSVIGGIMLFVDDESDGPVTLVPAHAEESADVDTLVPPGDDEATEIFRIGELKHHDDNAMCRLAALLEEEDDDDDQERTVASVRGEHAFAPPLPVPSEPEPIESPASISEPPVSFEGPYDARQRVVVPTVQTDRPLIKTVVPEQPARSWSPQLLAVGIVAAALSSALTSWIASKPPAPAAPADCNCLEVAAAAEPAAPLPCVQAVASAAASSASAEPEPTPVASASAAPVPSPWMKPAARPPAPVPKSTDPYGSVDE